MKKNLILALTIFLISCVSPQIRPMVLSTIKIKYNSCLKRCYDLNTLKEVEDKLCGADFVKGNYDISECDLVSGFGYKETAQEILPWAKETKAFYEDMEKRKRLWYCKKEKSGN